MENPVLPSDGNACISTEDAVGIEHRDFISHFHGYIEDGQIPDITADKGCADRYREMGGGIDIEHKTLLILPYRWYGRHHKR